MFSCLERHASKQRSRPVLDSLQLPRESRRRRRHMLQKSRESFREEVERALLLGVDYLVVHPGSARGACEADGIGLCAASLKIACKGLRFGQASHPARKHRRTGRLHRSSFRAPSGDHATSVRSFRSAFVSTPRTLSRPVTTFAKRMASKL